MLILKPHSTTQPTKHINQIHILQHANFNRNFVWLGYHITSNTEWQVGVITQGEVTGYISCCILDEESLKQWLSKQILGERDMFYVP